MAGTFHTLFFAAREAGESATSWPQALLYGIDRHARGRARERATCRLAWPAIHGLDASEWIACGQQPSDLGVLAGGGVLDVMMGDHALRLAVGEAMQRWPSSAWSGLYIDHELVPGTDGFPEIFGTCHWYVWWYCDRWEVSAMIEYPSSAVGRDDRWPAWIRAFHDDAARALARAPNGDGANLDVFAG